MDTIHRQFSLQKDDVIAGLRVAAAHSQQLSKEGWAGKFFRVLLWLALAWFFYQILVLLGPRPLPLPAKSLLASLAVLVTVILANNFYMQHAYRQAMLGEGGWMTTEQTVEFTPEAFIGYSMRGDWRIPWSAFDHTQEDAERFYFVLKPNLLFIMPKSVIGTEDEVQRVRAWSQSKA